MKIAYINGICQRHDAISNAIRDEIGWLRAVGHEVRLFAFACDFDDVPCTVVQGELDVAFDPFFQQCDMAVFHFGVYYALFNLLPAVPQWARRIVVFHNITPKHVLPASSHALIEQSFAQMSNTVFAHHVVCDSETNRQVLREAGIAVPATVLALAVETALKAPLSKPSFAGGVPRIAFVGRLVHSKGALDLLDALQHLLAREAPLALRLDLIANLHFSDGAVLDAVRAQLAQLAHQFGPRLEATLHGNASEQCKQQVLSNADLFVLPTRHEGFCVPILEALASGCKVLCYDNSNTPAVSGGLADLVPTGDVAALTAAMRAALAAVQDAPWRVGGGYQSAAQAAEAHLQKFSRRTVRDRFLSFMHQQASHRH